MAETTPARGSRYNGLPLLKTKNDLGGSSDYDLTTSSTLPSPSILAAREYHRDHAGPGIYKVTALHASRLSVESPRRHSLMTTTLTKRMGDINITSPASKLRQISQDSIAHVGDGTDTPHRTKQNDLLKVGSIATRRSSSDAKPATALVLEPIPFQYTHDRLRTWGHAYLGNVSTADAFINAVHLRRPSLALVKEGTINDSSTHTTIRARVLPKDKERKPFLIQKHFDVEDLRSNIPSVQPQAVPRRSDRVRQSLSGPAQVQPSPYSGDQRRGSTQSTLSPNVVLGAFPIHIEYALHYLPVLAALMLSGHVRKGDSIDLPMPQPDAWKEAMLFIYTGEGTVTVAVRENVLFFGGRAAA